jgi:hypothetical protein
MVKLLDPFSGYLLAYGNVLLHLGYFVALLHIPKNETCDKADYQLSWKLLLASHIMVFTLRIIKIVMKSTDNMIVSLAIQWLSIFFYQGSIFYT